MQALVGQKPKPNIELIFLEKLLNGMCSFFIRTL